MINYLDNKYKSNSIKSSIHMDRVPNLQSFSQQEIKQELKKDLHKFMQLFSVQDNEVLES
jgi:hypothetical protein